MSQFEQAVDYLVKTFGLARAEIILRNIPEDLTEDVTFQMESGPFTMRSSNFLREVLIWASGVDWYEPQAEGQVIPDWAYELRESWS